MIKFVEASSSKLVFVQCGTTYQFYADGTYRCDSGYFKNGELSNWFIEGDQLYFNHPANDQVSMRWDWKVGAGRGAVGE